MAKILVVDDEKRICEFLCQVVVNIGHEVEYTLTLGDGLDKVSSGAFDVLFLDVLLPDGNGLDALPEIRKKPGPPEVIIITAEGEPDGAELAIRSGVWDYIEKPFSIKDITLSLSRALQYRNERGKRETPIVFRREEIS